MTEGQIEYRAFIVDETPYCIWDVDIVERNAEFINSINPGYFSHVANLHAALLNEGENQYAAIALRTGYYHSLETLFALVSATVQDPSCIVGWLLKYQNRDLFAVVRKIDGRQPLRNNLGLQHITWDAISEKINDFKTGDEETDARLQVSFGRLWKRFAKDFLDEDITNEYNSIKHGLRVSMGGFSMAIGLETVPGVFAGPDSMRSLGGSAYGTSFPVVRSLNDKNNFQIIRQSMNWRPENLAHGLSLVSMSVHNIVSYLKQVNHMDSQGITFRCPSNEVDFDAPWRVSTGIERFNMDHTIDENSISTFSKEEILSFLRADKI